MTISYVGGDAQGSGSTNGGNANVSVTMPTIQANDVAILVLTKSNTEALSTSPTSSGFTLYEADTTNIASFSSYVWYKRLAGTESASSITASWTSTAYNSMALAVYRGVDLSQMFNTTTVKTLTANNTSISLNGLTTTWPNAQIVYVVADTKVTTTSSGFTHTQPAGTAERQDYSSSRVNALNTGALIADITQVSAGTVAATTATSTLAVNAISYTFALQESVTVSPDLLDYTSVPPSPSVNAITSVGPVTHIPTAEAVYTPYVNQPNILGPETIASAAVVYNPSSAATITVAQTATIPTAAAVYTPTQNSQITVSPALITDATPLGLVYNPSVATTITVAPTTIPTGLNIYTASFNVIQTVTNVGGIATSEVVYTPSQNTIMTVTPTAIATAAAIYDHAIDTTVTVSPTAIPTGVVVPPPTAANVEETWGFFQLV